MICPDDCPNDCRKCTLPKEEQDDCDSIDGRYLLAVNEYASTCDGCGDMTSHEEMVMDEDTQLGYCKMCAKELGYAPVSEMLTALAD